MQLPHDKRFTLLHASGVHLHTLDEAKFTGSCTSQPVLRFYTALILWLLVQGIPKTIVIQKIPALVMSALTSLEHNTIYHCAALATFCSKLKWTSLELLIKSFSSRLRFGGANPRLENLLEIDELTCELAQILFDEGFTTAAKVAAAEVAPLLKLWDPPDKDECIYSLGRMRNSSGTRMHSELRCWDGVS